MKTMSKLLLGVGTLSAVGFTAPASAAPIVGSFSLASFGGSYVNGTAANATGLDFGTAFGSAGNGFGTNGTALVGNATGSFTGLDGTFASIADISLDAFANSFTTNPFISFGAVNPITVSFSNAAFTRSSLGTSVTISGIATFFNGIAADTNTGDFTLAVSSQGGSPSASNFTFTGNASAPAVAAVPEPATWALMLVGFGGIGFAMRRRKSKVTTTVAYA